MRIHNWLLLLLTAMAGAALASLGFLSHAPNRIVPGEPLALHAVASGSMLMVLAACALILVVCSILAQSRLTLLLSGLCLCASIIVILFVAGDGARTLAASSVPAARTSLGPAFWIVLAAIILALIDLTQQARLSPAQRIALAAIVITICAGMMLGGVFDNLSLAREYRARSDAFAAEFRRHLLLVVLSAGISGVIGLPLGVLAFRNARFGQRLSALLGVVQTVPSIALFGLLIGPLSALAVALPWLRQLGISGIGTAPALIALVLYSLLPLVRNTVAGLQSVPEAVIDAARGNGMRNSQIMMKITLPLALPVILSGFRVVVIQTVGLSVVAALIGAGGLGSFVFQGLGQNAVDLVLLGVIPTVLMALGVDSLFSLATSGLRTAQ